MLVAGGGDFVVARSRATATTAVAQRPDVLPTGSPGALEMAFTLFCIANRLSLVLSPVASLFGLAED